MSNENSLIGKDVEALVDMPEFEILAGDCGEVVEAKKVGKKYEYRVAWASGRTVKVPAEKIVIW